MVKSIFTRKFLTFSAFFVYWNYYVSNRKRLMLLLLATFLAVGFRAGTMQALVYVGIGSINEKGLSMHIIATSPCFSFAMSRKSLKFSKFFALTFFAMSLLHQLQLFNVQVVVVYTYHYTNIHKEPCMTSYQSRMKWVT